MDIPLPHAYSILSSDIPLKPNDTTSSTPATSINGNSMTRARHESGYLRRYPRVHPWENPCKRITCVRVTRRLQNPRVQVSVLDHTQPVRVTRTTRGKHSHATTTTRRCLAHARHPRHCCHPRLLPHPRPSPSPV